MKSVSLFLGVVLLLSTWAGPAEAPETPQEDRYPELTARLEVVREALGIPGMAAAVVQDRELVWAQGFGYADVEDQVEVTPHTPFGLASVTKPVAATLVMQLVEEGAIELDRPIADYGVSAPGAAEVTVRHLLTHTSEGSPGETHVYNGNRYALLGGVIEGATGKTFADLLGTRILLPVGMMDTALNPIDSWGGRSDISFEEFRRAAGWGDSFDHYPDVYRRLASPYQLDDDYEIVPGMYQLTHSPAAGMVSSVVDLAAFDIALDRGELLPDTRTAEMFTPAVATSPGRTDVAYGLGWYVQEWAGHRMIWHTGRWPPSTSALYLKLPDEDLTFIVLANTDNLTVPFQGIGSGDLSRSTLMLTVFEQLVFDVPVVDWTTDKASLIEQLSQIDDPDTRLFLELELWSYRQALASSGNHEQAAVLVEANRAEFPGSRLRLDDSYTYTAPPTAAVPPVVSASGVTALAYSILAWMVMVAVSLVVIAFLLLRPAPAAIGVWVIAVPATIVMGPVAPLALLIDRRAGDREGPQLLRRGFTAAMLSMAGYALAWIPAIALLISSGEEPSPLITLGAVFGLPFIIGLLLVRVPSLRRASELKRGKAARLGAFPELLTAVIGIGSLLAVTIFFDNRVLSTLPHPTSPFFWGMLSVAALAGLGLLTLHYLLLMRRGKLTVPSLPAPKEKAFAELRLPRWRDSWWVLLGNAVVAAALLATLS